MTLLLLFAWAAISSSTLTADDDPHRELDRRVSEIRAIYLQIPGKQETDKDSLNAQAAALRKRLLQDLEKLIGGRLLTKELLAQVAEEIDKAEDHPLAEKVLSAQADLVVATNDFERIEGVLWRLTSLYRYNFPSLEKGEALHARRRKIAEGLKGLTSEESIIRLLDSAEFYRDEKKDAKTALSMIDQVLERIDLRRNTNGDRDRILLGRVAENYRKLGETEREDQIIDRLIEASKTIAPELRSVVLISSLPAALVAALERQRAKRIEVLEQRFRESLTDAKGEKTADKVSFVSAYAKVGEALVRANYLEKAEPYRRAVIALWDTVGPKERLTTSGSLYGFSSAYTEQKDFARAEPLVRRVATRILENPSPFVDRALDLNLALRMYDSLGLSVGTEPLYEKLISLYEGKGFATHQDGMGSFLLGSARLNLGSIHWQLGREDLAGKNYQKAFDLGVERKIIALAAPAAVGLGHVALKAGNNEKAWKYASSLDQLLASLAEPLTEKDAKGGFVQVNDKVLGRFVILVPSHRSVVIEAAVSLASLEAEIHRREGDLEAIDASIRKATDRIKGQDPTRELPRDLASLLVSLRIDQGRFADARAVLQDALKQSRQMRGQQHPETIALTGLSAGLFDRMSKTDEAIRVWDESRRGHREYLNSALSMLSEADQLRLLKENDKPALHASLSFARVHAGIPRVAESSAAWIVNGKGAATEVLARRNLAPQDVADPNRAAKRLELRDVRDRLARRSVSGAKVDENGSAYDELMRRERELARGLVGMDDLRGTAWVELADVRKAIPSSA